jgi:hypothetical protein
MKDLKLNFVARLGNSASKILALRCETLNLGK